MVSQIFISYRRQDTADITGRIYDHLKLRFGKPAVFKDVDSIEAGRDYRACLDSKLKECSVVLVVIGDDWLREDPKTGAPRLDNPEDFVRSEVEAALRRKDVRVIPLLVEGASMPLPDSLPEGMKDLVYRQARVIGHDPDFDMHMDALIKELESIFGTCQPDAPQPQYRPTPPSPTYSRPVPPPVQNRPVPPPVRPALQRPALARPVPPPVTRHAFGPAPAPRTSGSGKWILLTILLTVVISGFFLFLLLLAGLSAPGASNY